HTQSLSLSVTHTQSLSLSLSLSHTHTLSPLSFLPPPPLSLLISLSLSLSLCPFHYVHSIRSTLETHLEQKAMSPPPELDALPEELTLAKAAEIWKIAVAFKT